MSPNLHKELISLVFGIIDTIIYIQCNEIIRLLNSASYRVAKENNVCMDDNGIHIFEE